MFRYTKIARPAARFSQMRFYAAKDTMMQQPKDVPENAMNSSSESGIGKTHAKNDGEDSIVPKVIQKLVPESLERALPDSIHNTGDSVTHAKQGGEDSVVPKAAQKAVPEGLERALPDSIHNTGDSKK